MANDKLNLGWFSFVCCEDNTIMFAELLNDYFFEFKERFNFVDAPVLSSKRDENAPLDIAFVEGAVSTDEHFDKVKKIRARAKKVVAIGSCACTGMPSAHRNSFSPEQLAEIGHILKKFSYADKVDRLDAVIPVDAKVAGCPMELSTFLTAVNGLLVEFGREPIPVKG